MKSLKTCSRNFLGTKKIDWQKDKKQTLKQLLEKEGCYQEENDKMEIKETIMKILENSKKEKSPSLKELNEIYNNICKLDHHDCVRVDQIITRIYNARETDFQWGGVCMNAKWKSL